MSKKVRDISAEYVEAEHAALKFNPGEQPDIASLMRYAFTHGYAQALVDQRYPVCTDPVVDAEYIDICGRCGDPLADHESI